MAKPYRLAPLAQADLEQIWIHTAKNWSIEQADTYHKNLVAAFEGLATGAKRGRPTDVLPNFQKYLCGSHMVYFLDFPDRLDVIRVLHQRQDAHQRL